MWFFSPLKSDFHSISIAAAAFVYEQAAAFVYEKE